MQDRKSGSFIDGRRRFIRTGLGVAGGLALPAGFVIEGPGRRPAADRHLAGRRVRQLGVHRHQRAAHRHLRGAGRGRAQGLPAGHRAHQRRPSADQADLAQDHQGRARQGAEVRRRRLGRQAERRGAGAAALHHREQGDHDHRRHVERGGRGAEQAGAAREGAVRVRHLRLERHHRQGLRALRRAPELLRRDGGQRDRPGAAQGLRQEQEGRVHDARLHLRPHRHQVGERLPDQERRLADGDQPGVAARRARLQLLPHQHRQLRRRIPDQRELGPRRGAVDASRPSSSGCCPR